MKNLKLISVACIFLLLLTFNAVEVQAKAITGLKIQPKDQEKVFLLSFQTLGKGQMNIAFFDQEQNLLFQEELSEKADSFKKRFNLSKLKNKEYQLLLEDDFKTIIQPVRITDEGIVIDAASRKVEFKPYISIDDGADLLDVNWLLQTSKDFQLKIKDIENEVIYENAISQVQKVHRRYDISELKAGTYFLMLSDGDNEHYQTVSIH